MRLLKCLSIVLLLQGFSVIIPTHASAQHVSVSLQLFYDELAPYGTWINHPTHGYVWLPMDDPDTFFPYGTNGHWVLTAYGWTWVSYYKWGWAPFHYGRWDYDPVYGWFWVPDVVWGPAWVVWRHAPGYYGWAPMRPGITIVIVIGGGYYPPTPWWIFCEHRHFGRKHIHKYYTPRKHYGRILGESRPIDHTYEDKIRGSVNMTGPSKDDIRKETGREIDIVTLSDRTQPGQDVGNGTVAIYRPSIERTTVAEPKPAPRKLGDLKSTRYAPLEPSLPVYKESPIAPERTAATPPSKSRVEAPRSAEPEKTATPTKPAAPKKPERTATPPDSRAKPTAPAPSKPKVSTTQTPSQGTQSTGTTATPAPKKDEKEERSSKKK